jgi:5'-3' exoribonuclease 1
MVKASEVFPGADSGGRVLEVRHWLKTKGVRDFESVSLFCDHALYRPQNQHFEIGDRVTMVQDSGSVPLSVKGVVVGLNAKSSDVVWDVPFMSGGTLGNRYLVFV